MNQFDCFELRRRSDDLVNTFDRIERADGTMGVQATKSYLADRPEAAMDRLWLNASGQPLTTDGIRQIVDRLVNEAGVTGRHNLHAF